MHMSLLIKIMPGIVTCNKHVIEKHIMDLKISLAISGPSEHNFTSPWITILMISNFLASAIMYIQRQG